MLAANFTVGMPVSEVGERLSELRIPESRRLRYPQTESRPAVLLARVSPPGGMWLEPAGHSLEWVDVSFLLDETPNLTGWVIFRDGIRYADGYPVNAPGRALMGRVPRWPGLPPPPTDPLEGAE